MKLLIPFLFPFFMAAQVSPARNPGEVFKHRPERPYENVNRTGLVVVKKTNYGLVFEDRRLPKEAKNKVQTFFKYRLNGYTDLKTYRLKIERTPKGWRIEDCLVK